ncbi:restriction endonuclease subunit S [Viridibacillus sp. FSL R5-0888]|uniref:restriction endonuclease subunit S n=1 Tax=Viridibacillus sp. FSL R5-0888 TaxID=2921663 RepID=UPI0030F6F02D
MSNEILESKNWRSFFLNEIFTIIKRGKRLTKANQLPGNIPYVSSTAFSNGIDGFIGNRKNVRKFSNCITIANSGSVGSVFYHDYEFIASDHVTVLSNPTLTKNHYLFLVTVLSKIGDKYSFNREINDYRIKREKIMLPVDENENPDWDFIDEYTRMKNQKMKNKFEFPELNVVNDFKELKDVKWGEFSLNEIAKVKGGKDWPEKDRKKGIVPFVGSASVGNGITDFVNPTDREKQVDSNVIGVNRNGSVGYTFYHSYAAYFSGDTRFLKLNIHSDDKYINLFVKTMIQAQKDKYAWGYKMGTERIKRQIILLPVMEDGKIDYGFMREYMKRIENKVLLKCKNLEV